ncbi:hypothetical protein SAMN04488115_11958 [Bosea lathyri]|uniref:Uncharacterized protein n=1 Tax=Bosea lathyri TaxID=1036778 RepID=A0A1H6DAY0_9HYPH|nr:hypothetical protein SAMN04488115_11958 [Bosea lathyri]
MHDIPMEKRLDLSDPAMIRKSIRARAYRGYTAGLAPARVQANICILPRSHAEDFLLYCQRNPQPCLLLARSDVGDPFLTPQLAVAHARPPLCVTHAPSSMLVTDLRNASLASF